MKTTSSKLRIGTWNLAARWKPAHTEFLHALDCDVLLLTEVPSKFELSGYVGHTSQGRMKRGQYWAAVFSRSTVERLPDPHGASAMGKTFGLTFCASILPWRSCGGEEPWVNENGAGQTTAAVAEIVKARPEVWGGDWNHAFTGRETAGSVAGRREIQRRVDELGLRIVTADSRHQIDRLYSIDHIAVSRDWSVGAVERVPSAKLSDHAAYVVERI